MQRLPINPHDTPTTSKPMTAEELERIAGDLSYSKRVRRVVGEVRRCWTEIASLKARLAEYEQRGGPGGGQSPRHD